MIKVLICDGEGTLGLPNISPELLQLIKSLPQMGIQLAVATNGSRMQIVNRFRSAGLPLPSQIITPQETQTRKPSPKFVFMIQGQTGVKLEEIAYLGDDDKTDILCAINAGVLPFAATYSNPNMQYGLLVSQPKTLFDFLRSYGIQNAPYFGWSYRNLCTDTQTTVDVRVLVDDHQGLTSAFKTVLKDQGEYLVGSNKIPLQSLLFLYLVNQIYLSGLSSQIDLITTYPGHTANSRNVLLEGYSQELARTFKDRFIPDLLIRHCDAPESKKQGDSRNIYDQFRTILVNPAHHIQGKNILVLDDFTTCGYSLETARRMLIQAGAKHVVGLGIAKFRNKQAITRIRRSWNPNQPCTLEQADIQVLEMVGVPNPDADQHFWNVIWPVYSK